MAKNRHDAHGRMTKAQRDNRANQLNPNNPEYWRSRGIGESHGSETGERRRRVYRSVLSLV